MVEGGQGSGGAMVECGQGSGGAMVEGGQGSGGAMVEGGERSSTLSDDDEKTTAMFDEPLHSFVFLAMICSICLCCCIEGFQPFSDSGRLIQLLFSAQERAHNQMLGG